jgi:cytochrome oxidase Cu insertion factor (SCO1/SenC/PrrC family)
MIRILCGGLLIACLAAQSGTAAAERFKPFKLKTVEGAQHTLSDVLGKATLVVFFFPTCPYCNAAFPHMQKIYDTYKPQGLSMVWINVIPDETRLIPEWRASHGYTATIVIADRSVQSDYGLKTTPTHYVLDAKGNVLARHAGYKAGDETGLEREIQQALTP